MIEYQLKDKDGNIFSLNGPFVSANLKDTLTQSEDDFQYSNKVIENSYLPGSTLVGDSRLQARDLTLSVTIVNEESNAYRATVNELLAKIGSTCCIIDATNNIQIKVAPSRSTISYVEGALKHLSTNEFMFTMLTPYWEGISTEVLTGTAFADTILEVPVINAGYLSTPPVVKLVTTAPVDNVQMYLKSNSYGIQIEDDLFGTSINTEMTIDCNLGRVSVGDIGRNASIVEGTGFFNFVVGSDTLNILCSDVDVAYSISYHKRYYI